jgi:hypothetical protein
MTDFKIPDPKAPRFRKERLNILTKNFFKKLKKENQFLKALSDAEIRQIVETYNKCVSQTVIDFRDGVELPEQLGHIFVGTCPPKKSINKDYHASKRYKKLVQHRNFESDNHVAKIFYTTFLNKYRFKNHELWFFTGCREFTRSVSEVFSQKWNMYVKIDPMIKINTMFRSNHKKLSLKRDKDEFLKDYNELEI